MVCLSFSGLLNQNYEWTYTLYVFNNNMCNNNVICVINSNIIYSTNSTSQSHPYTTSYSRHHWLTPGIQQGKNSTICFSPIIDILILNQYSYHTHNTKASFASSLRGRCGGRSSCDEMSARLCADLNHCQRNLYSFSPSNDVSKNLYFSSIVPKFKIQYRDPILTCVNSGSSIAHGKTTWGFLWFLSFKV